MPNVLIIGATRGLGASLANQYAAQKDTAVYGTTRSAEAPKGKGHHEGIKWVKGVDLNEKECGTKLVEGLGGLGVEGGLGVVVSSLFPALSLLGGRGRVRRIAMGEWEMGKADNG